MRDVQRITIQEICVMSVKLEIMGKHVKWCAQKTVKIPSVFETMEHVHMGVCRTHTLAGCVMNVLQVNMDLHVKNPVRGHAINQFVLERTEHVLKVAHLLTIPEAIVNSVFPVNMDEFVRVVVRQIA